MTGPPLFLLSNPQKRLPGGRTRMEPSLIRERATTASPLLRKAAPDPDLPPGRAPCLHYDQRARALQPQEPHNTQQAFFLKLSHTQWGVPFLEHLSLVPLPSRQCSSPRRTLLVPSTPNHSANTSLPRRNRQAKPHMECGNLLPLSPVPLPSRQCPFLRRTLLVPFTPNHSANSPRRDRRITCPSVSPFRQSRRDVPKPARGGADASGASNAQPRVRSTP